MEVVPKGSVEREKILINNEMFPINYFICNICKYKNPIIKEIIYRKVRINLALIIGFGKIFGL